MNRNDSRPTQTFTPQGSDAYTSPGAAPGGQAPGVAAGGQAPPTAPGGPPQKQKSWFARHKILTALLAVVVLVVLVNVFGEGEADSEPAAGTAEGTAQDAAGDTSAAADDGGEQADNGAAAEEPAADGAAAEEPAEEPAEDTAPGIGDAVRDGNFEFTVTEVETSVAEVGNEFLGEEAQGQFVLVHMAVGNIGDQAQMLSGSNQTLVDTEGREHSANSSAAIYLDDSDTFLNDINPGNSVDGIVVFDIPADAEPATIELHDSMFSGGVTVSLTD